VDDSFSVGQNFLTSFSLLFRMSFTEKDNLNTNIRSISDIDWFFDFQNPKSRSRIIWFLVFGLLNFTMSIIALWFYQVPLSKWFFGIASFGFASGATWQFYKRGSYFRFFIYGLCFVGLFGSYFVFEGHPYYLIPMGITLIFLTNFISIDLSRQRGLNPFIRSNKMKNFQRFGSDNYEDM